VVGRLSRRVPPRRILMATLPAAVVAAALVPLPSDLPFLMAGWTLLGLSSGATVPAIFAWLGRIAPSSGGGFALLATTSMLCFAIGPILMGQATVYGLDAPFHLAAAATRVGADPAHEPIPVARRTSHSIAGLVSTQHTRREAAGRAVRGPGGSAPLEWPRLRGPKRSRRGTRSPYVSPFAYVGTDLHVGARSCSTPSSAPSARRRSSRSTGWPGGCLGGSRSSSSTTAPAGR